MHNRNSTHIACDITHRLLRSAGPPVVIYDTINRCVTKILAHYRLHRFLIATSDTTAMYAYYQTWTNTSITRHNAERWQVRLV